MVHRALVSTDPSYSSQSPRRGSECASASAPDSRHYRYHNCATLGRHLSFRPLANSIKLTGNAERFLEPDFTATGAQKAWCQILNTVGIGSRGLRISLDYAFLTSLRHSWLVLFDRMPDEPLTFELGESVQGVRISIRVSGLGGLIQMWRRFSGHCYEDTEKVDLCVALWERRYWLQMSTMRNAILAFEAAADPLDPFTNTILDLWYDLNRMRNNRADLLRQQIDRLWDWCTGAKRTLPTEVLLEPSHLHYSTEVLE
ncbi:LOW QUALITY PROTEIN: hypothetical protein PHMEG_00028423 [Phytophthora megakarya]|uniref:Uncharacterized protein n=1 Tax=Phytophthora megakarya TaxID=4795 RepID=A0A225V5K8_9STRA|nr:LOW QUALITY PROTEIN: hypothetical protein PHMEG_00028423 [Phytophthora megakarya]